jgi:replication-associated recombination protein RarA
VIGHRAVRAYLERTLPTATLLYGPPSIGKWTLARHLADHHHVHNVDRWCVEHGLNIETVRLLTHYAARAPHGSFKLVLARLDGSNTKALNAMLKTLEEPPPRVKFLFTTAARTLPTISSRCVTFELGMLTATELETLYLTQGYPQGKARRAAAYARGQVDRGYAAESADAHRNQVISLAKAITAGDRDQFTAAFAHWDGRSSELLSTLFTECLTHRWSTFSAADAAGLDTDRRRLWQMVAALMRVRAARPRLGVRAAMEPFLVRR